EHEETEGQQDAAEPEDPVLCDVPDHGQHRGGGDTAADGDSSAAYGRLRMRGPVRGDVDDAGPPQQGEGDEGADRRDRCGHDEDHQRLQIHQWPAPVSWASVSASTDSAIAGVSGTAT